MKEGNDDFFVGYAKSTPPRIRKATSLFVILGIMAMFFGVVAFSYNQRTAANSHYDFGDPTVIVGVYHESPYPMLRVTLESGTFKDLVLIGAGKLGPQSFLEEVLGGPKDLNHKKIELSGQLVYYNGKSLLEVDGDTKVKVMGDAKVAQVPFLDKPIILEGEVVDPKCYFGVMKPGYGKIHRSCATLCIRGGIPPVFTVADKNGTLAYYLMTDLKGNTINGDILPYIGQPLKISGLLDRVGEWNVLKLDPSKIEKINKPSNIY